MKTIDIASQLQEIEEQKREFLKLFGITLPDEAHDGLAAIRMIEIVRAAQSCKTSCGARAESKQANAGYSASFGDGEQRTARKVAEEARWFCDLLKPLFDLILEDNEHAPG